MLEDQDPKPRRRLAWVRIVVSVGLVALLLTQMDLGQSLGVIGAARFDFLALMLAVLLLERFVSAYRWWVLVRVRQTAVRYPAMVRIVYASNFLGVFLPGVGIDLLRVVGLSRITGDRANAFASVLVDRVFGLLTLAGMVLAGVSLLGHRLHPMISVWAAISLAAIVVGALSLMHSVARHFVRWCLSAGWARRIRAPVEKVYERLDSLRDRPRTLLLGLALSLGLQCLRVLSVALGGLALGIHMPLLYWVAYVPIIIFIQILPISVAGFGAREAAFVYFLGRQGVSPEAAFALSILFFFVQSAASLPGAACLGATKEETNPVRH